MDLSAPWESVPSARQSERQSTMFTPRSLRNALCTPEKYRDPEQNVALEKITVSIVLPFMAAFAAVGFLFGQVAFDAWGLKYNLNGRLLNLLNGGQDTKTSEYNIQQSVQKLWALGEKHHAVDMYVDAMILFILSALVPHIKLVLSMANWYWPSVPHHKRLQRFLFLDNIGRWNHYDIIVVVLFVSTCKLAITLAPSTVAETYLDLYTYTCQGAYYYCISVILSQLIGHWLVSEIRAALREAHQRERERRSPLTPLELNHEDMFIVPGTPREPILPPSRVWCIREEMEQMHKSCMIIIPVAMGLNVVLFLISITGIAYIVEYKIPTVDMEEQRYSMLGAIFDMMEDVPSDAQDAHGQQFIGVLVLVFILFAPCIRLVVQGTLWYMPMSARLHSIAELVHEVAMLWSCLDVSLFAGLLVVTEMKPITSRIFDCPTSLGPECFYLNVKPGPAFIIAFFSIAVSYTMNMFMNYTIIKVKERVHSAAVNQPIIDGVARLSGRGASAGRL